MREDPAETARWEAAKAERRPVTAHDLTGTPDLEPWMAGLIAAVLDHEDVHAKGADCLAEPLAKVPAPVIAWVHGYVAGRREATR